MVDNLPLVSVALTTYNGEKYLPVLLDSLLAQTYKAIEIIVVDDVSTDKTLDILQSYSSLHRHIKVYVNEQNLGYVKNFEKAFSLCSGEYIAPCDQDDCWLPDKVLQKVNAIDDYPMIYCDSWVADKELQKTGKRISDSVVCKTYTSCLNYAIIANVYGHASLFKRSLYLAAPLFPTFIPHDWWLAFNATLYGGVKFLNEPLILYRQHPQNLFGIIGEKRKAHNKQKKATALAQHRSRINLFYSTCPGMLTEEKRVLYQLNKSYTSFSLSNNFLRMFTFLRHYQSLLAVKKRSTLHKLLFCFKMFVKTK